MRSLITLVENASLAPFATMSREEFLGNPRITSTSNAKDLRPKVLTTLEKAPREPFLNGRYEAAYNADGAVVFDDDTPIASYNFGDTLVVDKRYRRQGIAVELVYQWRIRNPDAPTAKYRTKMAQGIQNMVWDRIQRELANGSRNNP